MFQKSGVRWGSAVVALALLFTSCGGGDSESSNRQRNTALAACITASVAEELQIGTSGANIEVAIGVCSGVTAIQFIDESTNNVGAPSPTGEGSTTPLNIEVPALTEASPTVQRKVTVRAFGVGPVLIAEDIVTLTVSETGAVSVEVTPGNVTGSDKSPENSSALVPVTNLALTFTSSDGTRDDYVLSFEYPATELERVDGFLMETGLASSGTKDRNTMINKKSLSSIEGGSLTFKFQPPVGQFLAGMTYDLQLTPYVLDSNNPNLPKPEISAAVSTTFIAASGEPTASGNSNPDPNTTNATSNSQSPTEPQTPTNLKLSEGDTRVLTWTPSRTSETGYVYDATKYPYRYRVNWRRTDSPKDLTTFSYAESAEFQLNRYDFKADVEYEFTVQEEFGDVSLVEAVSSAASTPLVKVPFTTTDLERIREAEAAALEKSRRAAIECMKTAPKLELLLRDPSSRTVDDDQPVNSDDEIMFGVLHPCETDVVAELGFHLKEIDPVSRRVYFSQTRWANSGGVTHAIPGNRLAPGQHTFIIETQWQHGDPFETDSTARDALPSTSWTIEVMAGTRPYALRCNPENVIIADAKVTVDCEDLTGIRWTGSDIKERNVAIDLDKREVMLPEFPDGWNRFGLSISQESYGNETFHYMVCLKNCDNPQLEREFTTVVEGDTVRIGFKQNDCGGNARAEVTEYVKITDNLFYSFNSAFSVDSKQIPDGETVDLVIQPFTEALRASRRDNCSRRHTVYSFMKINRPSVEPLDPTKIALPPETLVFIKPEDLVTAEQQNIGVPAKTQTVTIPSELLQTLAPTGGMVTVAVGADEPELLIDGSDLSLALPPTAKSITFKVTDSKGRVTQVTKPIVRQPETEIVQVVEDAGETVPKAEATPASEVSDSSGSSPLTLVLIALVVLVLALIAFQFVRRKA